jgi:asparagine synthase (glutamine-hydrolysing)
VYAATSGSALVNRMLAFDWRYTLADNDLPKVIGATQLAGLSVGFPLLDDALTDFSLQLDPEHKLRRLQLRWFFKEALRDFLPDAILTKKKHGFGLPFGAWANTHAGLKSLALDSIATLRDRGIVREAFLQELIAKHLPEHPEYYGEMVWILMMLGQWLSAYDGRTAIDVAAGTRPAPDRRAPA